MERAQSELNNLEATKAEAEEQKRVAEEVRAEIVAGADYGDLVDKVVNLTYENQKLQEENRGLRYKLNEAVRDKRKEYAGGVPGADWRSEGMGKAESGWMI